MNFTGSDWCGWCIKLDNEVFAKQEIKDFAKENLVLVKIDFRRSRRQSHEIKRRNQLLARQYQVQGFPTIIVLGLDGTQIGTMGYVPGGPAAFINGVKAILKKKPKIL